MGVILVTGASRGIGRGIAVSLSRAGHEIAVHYNGSRDAALQTARLCGEAWAGSDRDEARDLSGAAPDTAGVGRDPARIFQADISVEADRERLVTQVASSFGRIDGLVNNAGIAPRVRADIVYSDESVFDEVLKVNLYGPYFLTQRIARLWLEDPRPIPRRIVFVTSVSAEMPSTQRGEYCVSKSGLSMASRLFAMRLAGENVLVFEIRPGIIQTDMTAGVKDSYTPRIEDGLVPQRRWGRPEDIGSIARAIMGGDMDFCAGTIIDADGGLHIPRL